ncbi:MAG: MotA/TolQ/ExbB proton channel family protein [Lentisphaerae bacterium]|jgi:biopolymer transport protein ExbB|nr:MotA/TolQ/ExbB proton channel family protein [Lentisphaerota bacterium]
MSAYLTESGRELLNLIGWAGVALIGVAVVAIYLCVKNAVYLGWMGWAFRRHIARLQREPEKLDAAKGVRSGNPLVRVFSEAVRAACREHEGLRAELAFLFHKNFRAVNRGMTLLRLISVISPLLGLLGTVLGISKVFRVVAGQTLVNPALLANGIWEALTTTIIGLSITVPVLCLYYFLRMQINGFQIELMEYATRFSPLSE